MGQLPVYTIIGDGRLATHFAHYFSCLKIPFQQWSRQQDPRLQQLPQVIEQSTRLLLMISDQALPTFIEQHVKTKPQFMCQFSGCISLPGVIGLHPLHSFANHLYDVSQYESIPLITDESTLDYQALLPGLKNQCYYIPQADKGLYHALCVLAGNYSTMLWQKCLSEFSNRWQIPGEALHPYMQGVLDNLKQDPINALTGPLVRGDWSTVEANHEALAGDDYQSVYDLFVDVYKRNNSSGAKE